MSDCTTHTQNISSTSLYVGDLHPNVTESFLCTTFSEYGPVVSARICRDVLSHVSLRYGYVNFENPKDAESAIKNLNYAELFGHQIRIMWSQRDPSLRKSGRGNIFIKNLLKDIESKQLYETFSQFGKILSCKIALDDEKNSKGYGFIHFEDESCAQEAIKGINGKMINDRIVYVGRFIAKTDRPSNNMKMKFTNCYVKNFSQDLSDQGLYDMFVEFGKIKSYCIMRVNGQSKGFGFVCFSDPACAELAVQSMNGKSIDDRTLYVNRAQGKAERQKLLRTRFEKQRVERISRYAQGVNLYIKNLDDSIDDNQLRDAFKGYGKITSAKVMTDENGRSKNFGFVCFTTTEEARLASGMNGKILVSKPLYVALAQRKVERQARLVVEHQQRIQQDRVVINLMQARYYIDRILAQYNFVHPQRFVHNAGSPIATLRWIRPNVFPSQLQRAHAPIRAGFFPSMNYSFVNPTGSVAVMSQNRMQANGLVRPNFRGQKAVGIRGLVSGTMPPTMAAAPMNNSQNLMRQVSGRTYQQYVTARPNSQHMINGTHGISQRKAMLSASRIRPQLSNQTLRLMQPRITGPSSAVPFNHSKRKPSTFKPKPSRKYFMQMNIKEILKLSVEDQRQHFGEIIFLKIHKTHPSMSRKFTGMFIGMDIPDLRKMVESDDFLNNKISEAIQVLKLHNDHADHANKLDPNSNSTRQTEDSLENVISALDDMQLSEVKTE